MITDLKKWNSLENLDDVKPLAGIYIIHSKSSGKYYIGETINCRKRLNEHVKLDIQLIHKVIKRKGVKDFIYHVEYHPTLQKEDLLVLEENLISKYNSLVPNGYNICTFGTEYSRKTPRVVTGATREKISKAHKGKTVSDETRKKMSDAKKGKPRSLEHQSKINSANTGQKRSQETRDKLSNVMRNRDPNISRAVGLANKGRSHSKDTRDKLSKSNMGHEVSIETREKISKSHKGKVISDETKKRMSESRKRYLENKKHKPLLDD